MIITKVYGGLAGQMLQYALGRNLAIKNNTKLFLDISWFDNIPNNTTPRKFGLHNFNTKYELVDVATYKSLSEKRYNECIADKLLRRLQNKKLRSDYIIIEKDFSQFDSNVLSSPNNIVIDGYWNSFKYFESIRCILLDDFEIKNKEGDKINLELLNKIQSTSSVSLHIRRGDYVSNMDANMFHGVLDLHYYNKAIEIIQKNIKNPAFFIFSDDIQWAKDNLQIESPCCFIDHNNDEKNFWDLYLMRNCKHNILANSGFSWWGGWLNDNKNKIVIAPDKWVNGDLNRFDNIPNEWVRLK